MIADSCLLLKKKKKKTEGRFLSTNSYSKCIIFTATLTFKMSRQLIAEQLSKSSSGTQTRKQTVIFIYLLNVKLFQ